MNRPHPLGVPDPGMDRGILGFRYALKPDEISSRQGVQDSVMILATWAIFCGSSLFMQDNAIWQYAYYDTAKIIPGSPDSWGCALFICGLAVLVGMFFGVPRMVTWACLGIGAWNFFFALGLAREAAAHPDFSYTPVINYLAISLWALSCIPTYRRRNLSAVYKIASRRKKSV
ncbi:membrane protein [Gordonia phage Camerico]|nr:membrane protein [Gordonia phage Camerico]